MFLLRLLGLSDSAPRRKRKNNGVRRLTKSEMRIESLEHRALLSVSPHAIQPAVTPATDVATHYEILAPEQTNDGVKADFEVLALDAANEPVLNYDGTASIVLTGAASTGATAPPSITFNHGFDFFQATFTGTGAVTVTATDTTTTSLTGAGTTSVNAALVATQFLLKMPATETPGKAVNVTVEALDAAGHVVPNYTGTVTLSSATDPNASLPASYTFTSANAGQHTFQVTFSTKTGTGLQSVTATDNGSPTLTESISTNITRPAAATHFEVILPENVPVGLPTSVEVLALNANNQPVPNYTGTVSFSSSTDSTATLPASYTFTSTPRRSADHGEHTFQVTFDKTGAQSLTVADTANKLTATAITNVVAAPVATQLEVIAPENAPTGIAVPVIVVALDASNHPMKNYAGTVSLVAAPNTGVTITGPSTPISSNTGIEVFHVTFTTTGSEGLNASDKNGLTGNATTNVVTASTSGHSHGFQFDVGPGFGIDGIDLGRFGHRR